jgi:hypothetical protein
MDQTRTARSGPARTSRHTIRRSLATRPHRARPVSRRHRRDSHGGVVPLTRRVGTLATRPHPLRPTPLASRPQTRRPQRPRPTARRLALRSPAEPKHVARISTRRRAALARGMGRPHRPQRCPSRIASRLRVRHRLAARWLHALGCEHRGGNSTATPRHDHLTFDRQKYQLPSHLDKHPPLAQRALDNRPAHHRPPPRHVLRDHDHIYRRS